MSPTYVYGVTRTRADDPGGLPAGVGGQPVRRLSVGGFDALVTTVQEEIGLAREDVAAHGQVLDSELRRGTVAPMSFATVLDDDDDVCRVLDEAREDIGALLDRLDNHVEVSVRGYLREEAAIEAVIRDDPGIRRLRGRQRSVSDRIRLGEMVAGALAARADAAASEIVDGLASASADVAVGPPRSEDMAFNASFLVSDAAMADFDQRLSAFGDRFGAWMELHMVSPLPPYSFSDLVLTAVS